MKKILIIFMCLFIFTGCNNKEEKKEEIKNEKKETVIITSPNVNLDLIDKEYKETIDEYLSYVPLRKINIFKDDAYSKNLIVNNSNIGMLAISSSTIYKKNSTEIKACGESLEGCAVCFDSNNCILTSEIIEKMELYYNKFVTPSEIMNELYSKLNLYIDYSKNVLKISKVLSFDSDDNNLYIYEQAAFAFKNDNTIDVYKTSNKEDKILSIESNDISSKEVIDKVLENINKFNKYKHTFKTREQESDFYYYWYSTEVE